MAAACLDGRAPHHADGARSFDLRPQPYCTQRGPMKPMLSAELALSQPIAEPPKIEVRNLSFYYGASQALKNISLSLPDRTVTAFIGPSGCGKSTLLRCFNRIYELYPRQRAEGEILLDGENILDHAQDLNLLRTRIGMVFQKPTPFPMSIYENLAFEIGSA